MDDTMNSEIWLTGKSDGRRFILAFLAGLLLEAGGLAILLPVMTHPPPPAETQSIVKLSIIAPSPPAPLTPPPKPHPVTPPKPVSPPPPLPVAPPLPPAPPIPVAPNRPVIRQPPRPRHLRQPPALPQPVAQAPMQPTPPTPAPPPAPVAPAQPSAGQIDLFQAQMAEAVQRAATADYPEAAQMAHENGDAEVSFMFEDGAVSDVVIIQSSGYPLLDAAAEQAVRDAHYPQQPPDFAGRPHNVRVLERFQITAADVDGD
jgi:TonB family protein